MMKIERINDSQIRCTLSSFDLNVRNLNLGELAYGSDKARRLFKEMIQKASSEVGFEAEDLPLMVEAIPLSNESVMLVITKVDDPEEVDTRFAKFSPASDDDDIDISGMDIGDTLEGSDSLLSINPNGNQDKSSYVRIYVFDSLDRITEAAMAVNKKFFGINTLYKNPIDKQYYLTLKNSGLDPIGFATACNTLAEYGEKVRQTYSSESYYDEHYEVIIRNHALQSLVQIG